MLHRSMSPASKQVLKFTAAGVRVHIQTYAYICIYIFIYGYICTYILKTA